MDCKECGGTGGWQGRTGTCGTCGAVAMRPLNLNEIKYVENLTSGMSSVDSYVDAFNSDPRQSRKGVRTLASRLKARPHVKAAIEEIREAGVEQAEYNVASHIGELQRLKREALENKNYGAAVRAEELTGKVAGFYTDKKEITFKSSADNILNDLAKVFGVEFAEQAAKKLGVSFAPHGTTSQMKDVTNS